MKAKPAKPAYPTPALEKGLDILELLAKEPEGLTKSEIARRLNRTFSEIFRMLVCLEDRGYISQADGNERVLLTLKLFRLGQEHPPTQRLITKALPIMRDAVRSMMQSCHLAVVDDGQVVILAQVDSPTSQGFYVRTGSTVDLMQAASGHVVLAFQPPDARMHAVERWRERTRSKPSPDLQEHLKRILEAGFEERPSYEVEGIINISFPVFGYQGDALAALTVPYIKRTDHSTSTQVVRKHLRHATELLTRTIGGVFPGRESGRAAPAKSKNLAPELQSNSMRNE